MRLQRTRSWLRKIYFPFMLKVYNVPHHGSQLTPSTTARAEPRSRRHVYMGPCQVSMLASCSSAKTFKQAFWLAKWGHHMPKRTVVWSNSAVIRCLDLGNLKKTKKKKSKKSKTSKKPSKPNKSGVVTYMDKKGRRRCHGTPQLKRSQYPDCIACQAMFHIQITDVVLAKILYSQPSCH